MTDDHREAYNELLDLIQEAGYEITDERFRSTEDDPEFNVKLWLIPPSGSGEDHDTGGE